MVGCKRRERYLLAAIGLLSLISSSAAFAANSMKIMPGSPLPRTKFEERPVLSESEPVLLEASEIDYDHQNAVVTASDRVEVVQGDTVLLCDKLTYNQKDGKVYAEGNVSMLDPSGHVIFADRLEVTSDMRSGVIEQFKVRLADQSSFAAVAADKLDENRMKLYKAVYSPCRVSCDSKDEKSGEAHYPLWQLTADEVMLDNVEQRVKYEEAFFEVDGVPILYSPYFSHPTPDAPNQSGLLLPDYQYSQNYGSAVRVPMYYAIGQDRDVTLTPMITTTAGQVFMGEYRQQFDSGPLTIAGSITNAPDIDALGNRSPGHDFRGDISGNGRFRLNETYEWGFNGRRTSDDTYLRRYGLGEDTLLTSRVYAEGMRFENTNDRSYGIIQALAFQGLTAQDNSEQIPLVAPLTSVSFQSDPGIYNSRFTLDAGAMSLTRELGADSRRISSSLGWKLPYISDDGQAIEFSTKMRTDMYSVNDVMLDNGQSFNGVTGRAIPEVAALWRYPFINQMESSSVLLEPVVNLVLSPGGGNPAKIPNEDSLAPEFTDSNLFSSDRYAGYDRVETGPRMSYGVRGQAQFLSDRYVDWVFGQQYRVNNDPNFPISNDLTDHFSDYVGRLGINYQPLTLDYSFRLDKETLSPKRTEVTSGMNYYPVSFSTSYLSIKNDPIFADKEQLLTGMGLNFTREWMWTANVSRDLLLDQYVATGMSLGYRDECTAIVGLIGRSFTRDRDVEPATTFLLLFSFKNLN
ncbi:MAG: LPS assembly protein LptD [Rickettsiales bacterium]|nr:LPS assembly protein LptD [Rickettsiales bacterium]